MVVEKINEVKKTINEEIRKNFGIHDDSDTKIADESDVFIDLGADRLDLVELIMELEDIFYISISERACDSITTVGDIYKVVIEALENKDRMDV